MSWKQVLANLACLALGGCAGYESVEGHNWIGPNKSPVDMRFFPPAALRAGKSAVVGLSCFMQADGHLSSCKVAYVSTPGLGFEASALRMVDEIVIRPSQAKLVAEHHAKYMADHHIAASPGAGWVSQPIYLVLDDKAYSALAAAWRQVGEAATQRFTQSRPEASLR